MSGLDRFRAGAWRAENPPGALSSTEPVLRQGGQLGRATRAFPRDRPIGYTIAPSPARQIWELHRIREESRQQSLVSPHFRAFLEWAKVFVVGEEPFGIRFPLMPSEDRDRLRDVAMDIRDDWRAYQDEPIGMRDETLAEIVGQTQDWMLVDGDCFVIPRMGPDGSWRYQTYPGDSLAETSHTPGTIGPDRQPQRALGVEIDSSGRPLRYWFGQRAGFLSLGYTSWSTQVDAVPIDASRVWHIRDRRSSGGTVRGWPRIVGAFEYIARLNEFDQAFIRAAIRRVGAAIALKRDVATTFGDDDDSDVRDLSETRIESAGPRSDESIKPYQESEADAGNLLELDPGYEPVQIQTGSPSAQEALIVGFFENRICAALGVSYMSLTGNYSRTSFSGGQLGLMRDRATCGDLQGIQRRQVIRRVYLHRLMARWPELLMRYPGLRPDDYRIFAGARHTMAKMPVLEKGKVLTAVTAAFEKGIVGYAEARAEAGFATDDVEAVIAEWREQRELLGGGEPDEPGDAPAPEEDPDDDEPEEDDDESDEDDDET